MPSAGLYHVPLLRPLLRALIFAVTIETIFNRLLTVPDHGESASFLGSLGSSTARAGSLMFMISVVLLVASLVALANGSLRTPLWRGRLNTLISVGLLTLCALGISASLGPRGPTFAAAFNLIALAVHLAMIAVLYESRLDWSGRIFSVSLAGGLLCMSLANLSSMGMGFPWIAIPTSLAEPAMIAGRWLLMGAGVSAYAVFFPAEQKPGPLISTATYAVPAATAFTLIFGVVLQPSLLSRMAPGLVGRESGNLELVLTTGAAAAALFLIAATAIRGLANPFRRPRAFGLLLLLFSGYPHHVAYQHLLALLGVALLTVEDGAHLVPGSTSGDQQRSIAAGINLQMEGRSGIDAR